MKEAFSDCVDALRNSLARPNALEDSGGGIWQQAKGAINCAHMRNPEEQRSEVVLSSPGEVGIHHLLDPELADGSLGAHLRVRKESWAKVCESKYKNKPERTNRGERKNLSVKK
jgi:hypothetical protein